MTKQDEINILRDAVKRLGPDSYCAGWLADQLPAIEQSLASDIFPSQTFAEIASAYAETSRLLNADLVKRESVCAEHCASRSKAADEQADKIVARVVREQDALRGVARQILAII